MIETDVCIIGAGPAGIMAACAAAAGTNKVVVLESNSTAGRKLLLTGRGRCNLTHIGSTDEIIKAYKPFDRFVRHCIYEFPPQKLRDFFDHHGLETIVEQTGCVFPKTNRSSDVCRILTEELKKANVKIFYGTKINSIKKTGNFFTIESDKFTISAESLIIATGGVSWPQTGSTGDGYKFAQSLGHKIITPRACLIPLVTAEKFCSALAPLETSCPRRPSGIINALSLTGLAGIGIQNVVISRKTGGKKISSSGAMIFTHNGIGGPAVLDFSRLMTGKFGEISIDFLPDLDAAELNRRLYENSRQSAAAILCRFLPKAVVGRITEVKSDQIDKKTRKNIVGRLKNFPLTISGTEPIEKATVTGGGVDNSEIDPKTMESKLCKGLFFAGEVIDVDGPCGGYNLQFAFSSGFLAGKSTARLYSQAKF